MQSSLPLPPGEVGAKTPGEGKGGDLKLRIPHPRSFCSASRVPLSRGRREISRVGREADCYGSLRLHTFATVLGLMLVSLAKIALRTNASARQMMDHLGQIRATLVRTTTGGAGRRPTVMLAPALTTEQRRAVGVFALDRWFPGILSSMPSRAPMP